jgi:hypothetical protein
MSFRAKKIRIQIPCGGSGSILDPAGGCGDSPQSALCPDPPPPPPPPEPPCGVPSHFFGLNPWDEVVNPAPFVLSSEDLPALKRELELKLKMLAVADEASSLSRQRIETKLADIGAVEKALKKEPRK